ncbi:zinc finger, PMZ-type containing protein [Tanacetum coccineum]
MLHAIRLNAQDDHTCHENLDDLKDIVDFEDEGEENVGITKNTTDDPWLNKLVGNGNFIGQTDDATSNLGGRFYHKENDPEDDILDPKYENDHSKLLVYCGGDVSEGKCAFFKGKKPKDKTKDVDCSTNSDKGDTLDDVECSSKPVAKKNGRSSEAMKERWKTKDMDDDGKITFQRMYICFKGIKQGWLDACRKVVVGVENKDNWAWFLSLLQKDLELGYGGGLTLISDGHKGLLEVVADVLQPLKMDLHNVKNQSFKLEDTVTPSVRKRLELLKDKQRSSKKRGTIRIGSPIKRGEENQLTEGGSMDDGNLNAEEYQNKIDMEALAEVERENAAEEAEQERIRQIWAENEANDLYWENMAKEFRDEELPGPEDSLDDAYSFDTISDLQDNELNVYQVSVDLPVNEAPENYTTEESQAEDPDPKPIVPTQESQIQTRSKIRKQVNRGRSERITMMKVKKFKFDANGTGSTADKAFDVSEDEE